MSEPKNTCEGCKFAEWNRTSNGRRHPDGTGKCTWRIAVPLAASAYTGGFGRDYSRLDGTLTITGRSIWRGNGAYTSCPVRERAG